MQTKFPMCLPGKGYCNHPDYWMDNWIHLFIELSSLFRKYPNFCQATHPNFTDLAYFTTDFTQHLDVPNPDIEQKNINGNLCWNNVAQNCSQYLQQNKKIAIGENSIFPL